MDFNATLQVSQLIVNELTEGAFVHKMQGLLFKSQGFEKLGQKYIDHFNEEMEWVEKFVGRILDLGGDIKFEGAKTRELIKNPIDYIKADCFQPSVVLDMR